MKRIGYLIFCSAFLFLATALGGSAAQAGDYIVNAPPRAAGDAWYSTSCCYRKVVSYVRVVRWVRVPPPKPHHAAMQHHQMSSYDDDAPVIMEMKPHHVAHRPVATEAKPQQVAYRPVSDDRCRGKPQPLERGRTWVIVIVRCD